MSKLNEAGAIPLLVLLSAVAMIVFLTATATFSFRNKLFSSLFPKSSSLASTESHFSFIDDQGNLISSTSSLTVKLRIYSKWPPEPEISPSSSATDLASPSPSASDSAAVSPSPSPTIEPTIYTKTIILSEHATFTGQNTITFAYIPCSKVGQINCVEPGFGEFITSYTFANTTLESKSLCIKFIPTVDKAPNILCNIINLVNPSPTETPTSVPITDPTEKPTSQPTEQPTNQPTLTPLPSLNDLQTPVPTNKLVSIIPRQTLDFLKISPILGNITPDPTQNPQSASNREAATKQNEKPLQFTRPNEPSNQNSNSTTSFRSNLLNAISGLLKDLLSLIKK